MLFGKGYGLQTVLLWVIFFCSLMNLFLFVYWLPEVLHLTGMTPPEAARATSYRELGAIAAVLYLGVLIDRFGPERALAANYAAGILFIAAIALVAMPYLLLVVVIFFSGRQIFLSACLFAAIAAVATGLLALRGVRAEPLADQSPA